MQYRIAVLYCSTILQYCNVIRYLLLSPATPLATLYCTALHCTADVFTTVYQCISV